jgi:RHS repeat-associated protein
VSFFAARWRADRSGDALLEADPASDNATEYVFLFFLDCRGAGNMSDVMTGTELAASGAIENTFFPGSAAETGCGKRIARREAGGAVFYYFADHLGSSRVVTNATGTILDDSDFYPFGGERIVAAGSGNTYKFTGKERDPESSLDYFVARYYSSGYGRFLSPDEFTGGPVDAFSSSDPLPPGPLPYAVISNPQSLNKYTYTWNNPLRFTDPDGHFIDTILDIAFVAYDIYELAKNPNKENARALALDVAGAAIPFATGLGRGYKAAKALNQELGREIARAVQKVDHIVGKNPDAKTIEAAKRELKGEIVALRPDGKPYDHVEKVRQAVQGLKNQIGELQKLLSKPNLSQKARKAIEERISKASKKPDEVEKQLGVK